MTILTWVHLADLQIRDSSPSEQQMVTLFKDFETQIRQAGLRLNFVFVTGDITASGSSDQYKGAGWFFDGLMQRLKLRPKNLYFVPGNHDSNRGEIELNSQINVGQKQVSMPVGSNNIQQYNQFVLKVMDLKQVFEPRRPFYVENLRLNEKHLAILGFNSAILEESVVALYERELKEFDKQVERALTLARDAEFKIALIHHPLSDISAYDGGRTSLLLRENCDVVLHAHRHDANNNLELILPDEKSRAVIIGGGSNFLIEIHPNTYHIGQVNLETGEGLLRRRILDERSSSWISGDERSFKFKVKLQESDPTSDVISVSPTEAAQSQTDTPTSAMPERAPKPSTIQPGYISDQIEGDDQLGITDDVNAFASVFTAKQVSPPLCLGLFGDWGSGKSFFMKKMENRIEWLATRARQAEEKEQPSDFCSRVVQINFNAWHYADSNLWASLASHIFKSLDFYLKDQGVTSAQRAELFRSLDAAKQKLEEASRAKRDAEQVRAQAEGRLRDLQQEANEKAIKLSQVHKEILKTVQAKEEYKTANEILNEAATELGLARTHRTIEKARIIVSELSTLGGRIRAAFLWLAKKDPNRSLRIGLLLVLIVLVPLAPLMVNWLLGLVSRQRLDGLGTAIAQITTFATGLIAWLASLLQKVSAAASKFEEAQTKVDDIIAKVEQDSEEKIRILQKEMENLRMKEGEAQEAVRDAQKKYNETQAVLQQAKDIVDGPSLAEFIQEQATNEAYRTQLGMISIIRQNLETLNRLLENSDKRANLPRIDRIMLYIDDLDRCPENKVVEVLQAVHLLLAFKLFIVVVGVDSRWLLHSLEKAYPALQAGDSMRAGWSDEELLSWESTPQNYLEKIFQVPYNLRPMGLNGFQTLIDSIMPLTSDLPRHVETRLIDKPTDGSQSNVSLLNMKNDLQGNENKLQPLGEASGEIEVIPNAPLNDDVNDFNLISDALHFEAVEQEFVRSLAAMIPTPRAAKRFINIYRLIRATIPTTELAEFVEKGEFRAVMILLAILTGFPRQSPAIFRKLLTLESAYPWSNTIGLLRPRQLGAENADFYSGILPRINAAEAVEWKRLYMNLNDLNQAQGLPVTVEVYSRWVPQVARFSFRVGKIASNYELLPNVRIIGAGKDAGSEYVEIRNIGDRAQIMTGWTLNDEAHHTFVFPTFLLDAGMSVRVWVGTGQNTANDLYWGRNTPVWNDAGDIATLRDATGSLIQEFQIL